MDKMNDMHALQQIRTAHSSAMDPRQAAQEFHAKVMQANTTLVVFFCSSQYDLAILGQEMNRLFGEIPVVGCTTAGEIGPNGYCERSLSGVSFTSDTFTAVTGYIKHLKHFDVNKVKTFAQQLLQQLESKAPTAEPKNSFAFLMIDGLSVREEITTRTLQNALGKFPMFGGSAGDDLQFEKTHVFYDGQFHSDSAVLVLISTSLPFKLFKIQHFASTNERLVVTEADAINRIVKEINGLPAASEYARLLGIDTDDLDPMRFATSPLVVLIDGVDYVRSIQKVNPDGSLTFYCAIEEGLVLRIAKGVDLIENMQNAFDNIQAEIGAPQLVLSCDCILRNLEITQSNIKNKVGEIFKRNHTVGFSTYGEQFGGVHVNQTLTGIAIGNLDKSGQSKN